MKEKVVWLCEEDTLGTRACSNTIRMDPPPPIPHDGFVGKGHLFPPHTKVVRTSMLSQLETEPKTNISAIYIYL